MYFRPQPIILGSLAADPYYCEDEDADGSNVAESLSQYPPRHPERAAFYQLFETHFDSYVRAYDERFEPRSGPLRPVVVRSDCHGLVTDGAFSADGEFLPLPSLDVSAVMQLFRRLFLLRLHQAERLSESLMQNLLAWIHPGFSVYAGAPVNAAEIASIEAQARYVTRAVLGIDALRKLDDGSLIMETPPDPRTGATSIELDPLEWIHRITAHIPDPGRHCQRSYGAYSNRGRIPVALQAGEMAAIPAAKHCNQVNSDCSREARSTWARLIKKIFEADPLLCPCGGRMRIVSIITDPRVVDHILRHRESGRCKTPDPFEPRPPPGASAKTPQ